MPKDAHHRRKRKLHSHTRKTKRRRISNHSRLTPSTISEDDQNSTAIKTEKKRKYATKPTRKPPCRNETPLPVIIRKNTMNVIKEKKMLQRLRAFVLTSIQSKPLDFNQLYDLARKTFAQLNENELETKLRKITDELVCTGQLIRISGLFRTPVAFKRVGSGKRFENPLLPSIDNRHDVPERLSSSELSYNSKKNKILKRTRWLNPSIPQAKHIRRSSRLSNIFEDQDENSHSPPHEFYT